MKRQALQQLSFKSTLRVESDSHSASISCHSIARNADFIPFN